jgi:hypothetical protein
MKGHEDGGMFFGTSDALPRRDPKIGPAQYAQILAVNTSFNVYFFKINSYLVY